MRSSALLPMSGRLFAKDFVEDNKNDDKVIMIRNIER